MTDPQKDEHIEELLSKLQGIFGKLSHSEEEEARQKIEIPAPSPKEKEPEPKPEPPPPAKPDLPPAPKPSASASFKLYPDSATNTSPSAAKPAPLESMTPHAPPVPVAPQSATASTSNGDYESMVPTGDPEKLLIPTAVYYPAGKAVEAKSLAQKLEMMTPKFTKVAFRLQVLVFLPYDPKSEWKDLIFAKAEQTPFQTVFVVVDRPLEDAKKKTFTAELEARNIYFQDVPTASIEKKAFYTDVLLGLVFFFDSRKSPPPPEGTNS